MAEIKAIRREEKGGYICNLCDDRKIKQVYEVWLGTEVLWLCHPHAVELRKKLREQMR